MVIFWVGLAPYIFPNLGWTGHDLYMRFHMVTLHCIPFFQTTFNTMLTDMELVVEDWTMVIPMAESMSIKLNIIIGKLQIIQKRTKKLKILIIRF